MAAAYSIGESGCFMDATFHEVPMQTDTLTGFQRYMLRRYHPAKIMLDCAGMIGAFYFIWMQDWVRAAILSFALPAFSYFLVRRSDPEKIATTTIGRIGLLHLHPINLTVQVLSLIPLIMGFWNHSAEYILTGLAFLFAGHFFGWEKVDERFKY